MRQNAVLCSNRLRLCWEGQILYRTLPCPCTKRLIKNIAGKGEGADN